MLRYPVIAVVGGGRASAPPGSPAYVMAEQLGNFIGESRAILLCGGGSGIMEAAAKGAQQAGGFTIGIMKANEQPNSHIMFSVRTNMGDGRNYLNASIPDVVIAMKGEAGTLSEIALAMKIGTPVVYLAHWAFLNDNGMPKMPFAASAQEAMEKALQLLRLKPGDRLDRPVKCPSISDQKENLHRLAETIENWCERMKTEGIQA